MTSEIFVDTGAWYAIADADDDWNEQARQIYRALLRTGNQLVTSNMVVNDELFYEIDTSAVRLHRAPSLVDGSYVTLRTSR